MEHWYDNEISRGILAAKYYHEGETTPQQFINRVSSIFKGDFRERIKEYITDGDFSPAGRTLYAAGSRGKFKVSMSNCYILPSPEDNLESIFHSNYEIARIFPMAAVSVSIFPISVLQEVVCIMWHVLPPVPFLS